MTLKWSGSWWGCWNNNLWIIIFEKIREFFTDIPDEIKAKETLKGTEYFEYDNNNFGAGVESSLAVQQVKIGERLDITKAQYDELIAIQQAGLEATKKLNALGSINIYSGKLPTCKGHNTTFDENPIDDKQIKHIVETI